MWTSMGPTWKGERGILSRLSAKCLLVTVIALIVASALADEAIVGDAAPCPFKPVVTSCDEKNVKYKIVLESKNGEKFILNQDIERILAPKPRAGRKGELVSQARGRWGERMAAWKEKMRVLIAKQRERRRRLRNRAQAV